MRRLRYRPWSAMVVSVLALFIALGGGAYAAMNSLANSVGTKQLKDNTVVSSKVKTAHCLRLTSKLASCRGGRADPQDNPDRTGRTGRTGRTERTAVRGQVEPRWRTRS